jgi:HD-GYP domain-containing protein (c-di-GMP phosphodiesterase class II)
VPVSTDDLREIELFAGVPQPLLDKLAAKVEICNYRAGDRIFEAGDPGVAFHIVGHGQVQIVQRSGEGPELELGTFTEGASIGELSVLNDTTYSASAVAASDCQTLRFSKDSVDELMAVDPDTTRPMFQALTRAFSQHLQNLEERVLEHTDRLRETQFEIIYRLGRAAEFRDDDTGLHITRMSRFAARLALEAGLPKTHTELLLHAAPMHDIGKIGIPDEILLKPGKLTDEEFAVMKTHTELGAELLAGSSSPVVQLAQQVALSHHEKWDGSGYPEGLKGENIPIEARICCVVDVFDALISERPYKQPWTVEDALAEIGRCSGTMFDPMLADIFVSLEKDVRGILERTSNTASALPAVSRSATMFFLVKQAEGAI